MWFAGTFFVNIYLGNWLANGDSVSWPLPLVDVDRMSPHVQRASFCSVSCPLCCNQVGFICA